MEKIIIIFVIALIFIVVATMLKPSSKTIVVNKTTGIIDKVVYSETGNVMYYVSFYNNHSKIIAHSDYYSSSTKSLSPGEIVEIGIVNIRKDKFNVLIYDDRITPCASSAKTYSRISYIFGIAMLLLDVILLVKKLHL